MDGFHSGLDDLDSLDDKVQDLKENLRRRLTLNGLNLGKRYIEGDLYLVIDAIDRVTGQAFEYVAGALPNFASWQRCFTARNCGTYHDNSNVEQAGMFVDNVKVMKGTKKVAIPSVVWFQLGNSKTDDLGNFLAFSVERRFECRSILASGEIRLSRRFVRHYGAAAHSLIESGSKIVEGVGGTKAEFAGYWLRKPNLSFEIPRANILMGSDAYEVEFVESANDRFEIMDVLFGPFDL